MMHELKIWPLYYVDIRDGEKTFEVRNNDRGGFTRGDILTLREWCPQTCEYTGRIMTVNVDYVCKLPYPQNNFVGMSISNPIEGASVK